MDASIQKRWKEYLAIRDTKSSHAPFEVHTPSDIKRLKKLDEIEREILRVYMFVQILSENKNITAFMKSVLNINEQKELHHIIAEIKKLVLEIKTCKKGWSKKETSTIKQSEKIITKTLQHWTKTDTQQLLIHLRKTQKCLMQTHSEITAAITIITQGNKNDK